MQKVTQILFLIMLFASTGCVDTIVEADEESTTVNEETISNKIVTEAEKQRPKAEDVTKAWTKSGGEIAAGKSEGMLVQFYPAEIKSGLEPDTYVYTYTVLAANVPWNFRRGYYDQYFAWDNDAQELFEYDAKVRFDWSESDGTTKVVRIKAPLLENEYVTSVELTFMARDGVGGYASFSFNFDLVYGEQVLEIAPGNYSITAVVWEGLGLITETEWNSFSDGNVIVLNFELKPNVAAYYRLYLPQDPENTSLVEIAVFDGEEELRTQQPYKEGVPIIALDWELSPRGIMYVTEHVKSSSGLREIGRQYELRGSQFGLRPETAANGAKIFEAHSEKG